MFDTIVGKWFHLENILTLFVLIKSFFELSSLLPLFRGVQSPVFALLDSTVGVGGGCTPSPGAVAVHHQPPPGPDGSSGRALEYHAMLPLIAVLLLELTGMVYTHIYHFERSGGAMINVFYSCLRCWSQSSFLVMYSLII